MLDGLRTLPVVEDRGNKNGVVSSAGNAGEELMSDAVSARRLNGVYLEVTRRDCFDERKINVGLEDKLVVALEKEQKYKMTFRMSAGFNWRMKVSGIGWGSVIFREDAECTLVICEVVRDDRAQRAIWGSSVFFRMAAMNYSSIA